MRLIPGLHWPKHPYLAWSRTEVNLENISWSQFFSGTATAMKAVATLHPGNSYWTPEPDVSESKTTVTGYRWFIVVCEFGKAAAAAAALPATRITAGATTCLYGTI